MRVVISGAGAAGVAISEMLMAAGIPGAKLVPLDSINHMIPPDDPAHRQMADAVADFLGEKRIRHLPVVVGERVVGVISIGDVVRGMIDDRDFHIEQLTKYVTGSF